MAPTRLRIRSGATLAGRAGHAIPGLLAVSLLAACAVPAAQFAPRTPGATPGTTAGGIAGMTAGPTPRDVVSEAKLTPLGATEQAVVVRVVDGDTLIVDRGLGEERLRYIGIDAPESVRPHTPVEFMGREASAANAALVEGREVLLERDVSERDRFDRLLRYVWLPHGDGPLLVNLELVRLGYANAVSFPPDVRLLDELRAAERVARDAGFGLWGPATPLP